MLSHLVVERCSSRKLPHLWREKGIMEEIKVNQRKKTIKSVQSLEERKLDVPGSRGGV